MCVVLEYCVACYIFIFGGVFLKKHYGHRIRILHWCTDHAMTNALAGMDLTAAQGRILGMLALRDTPPCPRDIEEAFHLSHPTVSGLLSRMEKKGFIEFRPDEADRRCKRIYMLPKGQQCTDTMHKTVQHIESQLVRGFTKEERTQFSALLERAIANMGGNPCCKPHKEESKQHD